MNSSYTYTNCLYHWVTVSCGSLSCRSSVYQMCPLSCGLVSVLMPGRYVGTEEEEDDGIPFEEKMTALTEQLAAQFAKGAELEATIRKNLEGIGYEF